MNERPAILFAVLGVAATISVAAQPSPSSRGADIGCLGAYPPSPVIAGLHGWR